MLSYLMLMLMYLFCISEVLFYKILFLILNVFFVMLVNSLFMKSTWMIMLFTILMVSGLLVMFMYMASLNNLYNKMKFMYTYMYLFIFMVMMLIVYKLSVNLYFVKNSMMMNINLNMFHSWFSTLIIIILILYLFILMILGMEMIFSKKMSFRFF